MGQITSVDYRKLYRLDTVIKHLIDISLKFYENNVNPVTKRTLQHNLHKNMFMKSPKGKTNGDKRS